MLMLLAVPAASCGSNSPPASVGPSATSTVSPSHSPSTVHRQPPERGGCCPPRPSPCNYQGVWTGTDLLIHAPNWKTGHGSIDAAYNPATNSWRRLPSSPYPVGSIEGGTQVVWDGTEMLTFGVMNAAYNPATKNLAGVDGAALGRPVGRGVDRHRVLMWGGGCCDDASAAGAAYDPERDVWRALPAAPLSGRRTDGVWTGTEMIIIGGQAHGKSSFADAAAYNPTTGSWRKLPPDAFSAVRHHVDLDRQ